VFEPLRRLVNAPQDCATREHTGYAWGVSATGSGLRHRRVAAGSAPCAGHGRSRCSAQL